MSDPQVPSSSSIGKGEYDLPRSGTRSTVMLWLIILWLIVIVTIVAAQFIVH